MAVNVTCDKCGKSFGGLGSGYVWISAKQTSRTLTSEKLYGDLCPDCSTELLEVVSKWCPYLYQWVGEGKPERSGS